MSATGKERIRNSIPKRISWPDNEKTAEKKGRFFYKTSGLITPSGTLPSNLSMMACADWVAIRMTHSAVKAAEWGLKTTFGKAKRGLLLAGGSRVEDIQARTGNETLLGGLGTTPLRR
jgi:hypothetical protein